MNEYFVTAFAKFQNEWEERFVKLWAELTVKEQHAIVPIEPPYTEERVVAFLAELKKAKESRAWSLPALFQKKTPFPTSDVRYWKMVEIPGKNYSIGKYPVTQSLWEKILGSNPSGCKGSNRPVENVSWFDCIAFCNTLSEMEGLEKTYTISGEEVQCTVETDGYRLPTEWEWWFAAAANQNVAFSGSDNVEEVAWIRGNSGGQTHDVGQKKANGFGLYDMSGNVDEWCWDRYGGKYEDIPIEDSLGPTTGTQRLRRGGSWFSDASFSQVAYRRWRHPSDRIDRQGVRLCRSIR